MVYLNDLISKLNTAIVGNIEPTEPETVNDVECLINERGTIVRTDSIDQAMRLVGEDARVLLPFIPDGHMIKKLKKEYPFMTIFIDKTKIPLPDMFYYEKKKPLIIEYKDKCFVFLPLKMGGN